MGSSLLESGVIENCAPTLAGMKAASLFNFFFQDKEEVLAALGSINEVLGPKGVTVEALLWRENSVLIYTFRRKLLQADLCKEGVLELLKDYGYRSQDVEECIFHLKRRLYHYECFPHEIGLFLGYPLEDVKGFIENNGKNCKSCGVWKVYCNEGEKQKLFEKFKKCTSVYIQVFREGRGLSQMTVFS
ncbi:MAG: DUF3793 family protein [Lachnospiraceae bacterium]|nr:DUF3793 family protein [Lachnospiraceae bacterium]